MPVRRLSLVAGTALLLASGVSLTACGGATSAAVEEQIKNETGQDADVDVDDGTITASQDGTSVTIGEDANLPADWPDLPTPDGGQVISSTSSDKNGKTIQIVTFKVDGDAAAAAKSLADKIQAAGYSLDGSAVTGAQATYGLSNDTYEIIILTLVETVTMTVEEKA